MNTFIAPAIFYVIITICIICLYKNQGIKALLYSTNSKNLKYPLGIALFFFVNINILFFCSICDHEHSLCINFIMSSVLVGSAVYLSHLIKQTINAIKQVMAGGIVDFMAPFFSIPYFILIYDIYDAAINTGLYSLHSYENKMLIVMLYPFFVVLGELTIKNKPRPPQKKTTKKGKLQNVTA